MSACFIFKLVNDGKAERVVVVVVINLLSKQKSLLEEVVVLIKIYISYIYFLLYPNLGLFLTPNGTEGAP